MSSAADTALMPASASTIDTLGVATDVFCHRSESTCSAEMTNDSRGFV